MHGERRGVDDALRVAFERLRAEIDQRVRAEQLRDQLTDLPNERALVAAMEDLLERKRHFWIAFFELDRFKWINDEFGYQSADVLLRRVAESLANAEQFFVGTVTAFRPHGDEFYLLGEWGNEVAPDASTLASRLDLIRQNIAALRVHSERGVAQCTVSVGWLETESFGAYLAAQHAVLTQREVQSALERTVAEAKWTRDVVTPFSPALAADKALTLRSDCTVCRCKFQVTLKESSLGTSHNWRCPNCGTEQLRPPVENRLPTPQPTAI